MKSIGKVQMSNRQPLWLYDNFLTKDECSSIAERILAKETHVNNLKNWRPSGYKGITRQYDVYNWLWDFQDDMGLDITTRLYNLPQLSMYQTLAIQCWSNILRTNENLAEHIHSQDNIHYCANVFISGDENVGTWYDGYGTLRSEVGTLALFTSQHYHAVPINKTKEPRISVAFDIFHTIDDKIKSEWENCYAIKKSNPSENLGLDSELKSKNYIKLNPYT